MQEKKNTFFTFDARCTALAERCHFTAVDLSREIGISRTMLYAYRTGKKDISGKAWRKLAVAEARFSGTNIYLPASPSNSPTIDEIKRALKKDPAGATKRYAKEIAELNAHFASTMATYPIQESPVPQVAEPIDTETPVTPEEREKIKRLEKEKGKMLTPQKKPSPMFGYRPRRLAP